MLRPFENERKKNLFIRKQRLQLFSHLLQSIDPIEMIPRDGSRIPRALSSLVVCVSPSICSLGVVVIAASRLDTRNALVRAREQHRFWLEDFSKQPVST
jgi:hypothetical protein